MSTPRFDLVDIAQTLQRRGRFILFITAACIAVGAVFYFTSEETYKVKSDFFVANPQYADHNHIFAEKQTYFIDYFGDELTNDRALVMAKSDIAKGQIISRNKLYEAWKLDESKLADRVKMSARFKKAYNVKRTEYGSLELYFTDTDPQRAADVCNDAVQVVENLFHNYFATMQGNIAKSLQDKVKANDSTIAVLTDSLVSMRDRYSIYDLVSPNRHNLETGNIGSRNGRGLEEIQNIESIKDQLVTDRARYLSLINEFSTGIKDGDLPIVQITSPAYKPDTPSGLGLVLTLVACAFVGFFFSAIWVLLTTYFRLLTSAQR